MRGLRVLGELAVCLVAIVGLFIAFNFCLMFWQLMRVTAPFQYENVLRHRWLSAEMIRHFPSSIPENALDVAFHFNAGVLQGGAAIELRARLPQAELEALIRRHRSDALAIFDAAGDHLDGGQPRILPKLSFYTLTQAVDASSRRTTLLPAGFETLLLWVREPVDMNHPRAAGISVSRERGEVIYWAEDG